MGRLFADIKMLMNKTGCVVVTYNSDIRRLGLTLKSILVNTPHILVVDNNSSNQTEIEAQCRNLSGTIEFMPLQGNMGIAYAQNMGISKLLSRAAELVWFSDQDSIYPKDYLIHMEKALAQANAQTLGKVAAIGPLFLDEGRAEVQPVVLFDGFSTKHDAKPGLNEAAHIISSGMLVPVDALRQVGGMAENLFIDWVDMEWCWRARRRHGLRTWVSGDVCMLHQLGDTNVRFMGRKLVLRNPSRHYYMVRNAVWLALWSDVLHLGQRVELFVKALLWTVAFAALGRGARWQHLKFCVQGLNDGLWRRMGPKR